MCKCMCLRIVKRSLYYSTGHTLECISFADRYERSSIVVWLIWWCVKRLLHSWQSFTVHQVRFVVVVVAESCLNDQWDIVCACDVENVYVEKVSNIRLVKEVDCFYSSFFASGCLSPSTGLTVDVDPPMSGRMYGRTREL